MTTENPYLELTHAFNAEGFHCILSSGQAVVVYGLAVMSKDGDWIIRDDPRAYDHVLAVLAARGATYRFGAPLDARWLRHGWSSHFEFKHNGTRIRTDFVAYPPRVPPQRLAAMWETCALQALPVVPPHELALLKATNRDKDYPVIAEVVRLLTNPREQLLLGRSWFDLIEIAQRHPALARTLVDERPLLATALDGDRDRLEQELDAERRFMIRANERRLDRYMIAGRTWQARWGRLSRALSGLPLRRAHETMCQEAERWLPFEPAPEETA